MNVIKMIENAIEYTKSRFTIFQNIQRIDNFIVFDALTLFESRFASKYTRFSDLEKEAIRDEDLDKLVTIYFTKQTVKTTVYYQNWKIENEYRESKRTKYYVEFSDSTHLLTITYRTEDEEDIFQIVKKNKEIKQKFSKGMQRMRMYFKKYFNFKLKYVYSKELTEKGFLHFHLLIQMPGQFRKNFKNMIETLARWFETENNGIDLKYLKRKDRKKAVRYVMKYITKQNTEMFYEIENTMVFFTTIGKIIRNMEKRVFSYSYARRPRIKRYRPQKFSKTEHTIKEKVVEFRQEKISKIFRETSKKAEQIIQRIKDEFIKCEWKIYDLMEKIKEWKKISELIDAERDAVDF